MDEQDEGFSGEAMFPGGIRKQERICDMFPSDTDLSPTSDNARGYDHSFSDYNYKELNPNVNDLFPNAPNTPNTHIRWKDSVEDAHAPGRIRPLDSRYFDQEGHSPRLRQPSTGSDVSSDGRPTSSNKSGLDIDTGRLFTEGLEPEIANESLASRRGRDRPAGLDLLGKGQEEQNVETVSSARFKRTLNTVIPDPEIRAVVEAEFDKLNDAKNKIAMQTWQLYDQQKREYNELMNDYYAGPGEERKRVRLESERRANEAKKARKERRIHMALNQEKVLSGGQRSGGWLVDKTTGQLVSDEEDDDEVSGEGSGDSEEEDADGDGAGVGDGHGRQFFSDEEDPRAAEGQNAADDDGSDDIIRDRKTHKRLVQSHESLILNNKERSRIPLSASSDDDDLPSTFPLSSAGHHTRDSVWSLDKPLPAIPAEETRQTLVAMQVLLRLLPVKLKLINQLTPKRRLGFSVSRPGTSSSFSRTSSGSFSRRDAEQSVYDQASEVCEFAEREEAGLELQGRCAFYMGLAEYLRSGGPSKDGSRSGNGDGGEGLAMALFHFENAERLCGEEVEEGEWAREWIWWVGRRMEYVEVEAETEREAEVEGTGIGTESDVGGKVAVEREGDEDGLVTKTIWKMMGWEKGGAKKDSKPRAAGKDGEAAESSGLRDWWRGGQRWKEQQQRKSQDGINGTGEAETRDRGSNTHDDGLHGGMVSISKLLTGEDAASEAHNATLLPTNGIFTTPERYTNGFDRSPTTPTGTTFELTQMLDSLDVGPSPMTTEPSAPSLTSPSSPYTPSTPTPEPLAPRKGKYQIVNPGSSSSEGSTGTTTGGGPDETSQDCPAPFQTNEQTGIFSTLARRLPTAISPTKDTSPSSCSTPTTPSPVPEHSPSTTASTSATPANDEYDSSKRLSIAERRSSLAAFASLALRGGRTPAKAQETLAEEGESPSFQTSFERDSGKRSRSPLGSPGSGGDGEEGLRRRSAGRGRVEDMV